MHQVHAACRSCGQDRLKPILALGDMPLANRLLTDEDLNAPEPSYPLNLMFCESCALVQISVTVPPEEMFREYLYFSSYSETMLRHARTLSSQLLASQRLRPSSLVLEIASNDGYL